MTRNHAHELLRPAGPRPPAPDRYLESAEDLRRRGALGRALAMAARATLMLPGSDPRRPGALTVLAGLYLELGRYADARRRAADALALRPGDPLAAGLLERARVREFIEGGRRKGGRRSGGAGRVSSPG